MPMYVHVYMYGKFLAVLVSHSPAAYAVSSSLPINKVDITSIKIFHNYIHILFEHLV